MDWTLLLRILTAVGVAAVGYLERRTHKKVDDVHVLVNSNLDEIKRQLAVMTAKRDVLAAEQADEARGHHRGA